MNVQWMKSVLVGQPLNKTKTITGMALLAALYVLLNSLIINFSPTLRVSFSFIALAVSCSLYGFLPNVLFCLVVDFLGFIVHPDGAYMPAFALVLIVKAFIYSFFFYHQKITVIKIIVAQLLVAILANILLNSFILMFMYHMPYWVSVSERLLKNVICFPIECLFLWLFFKGRDRFMKQSFLK